MTADGSIDDLDGDGSIDPLGFYYFSVTPGTYYVYEENQDNWVQTAPSAVYYGPLVVSAITPTYLNKDFGDYQLASKSGVKFEDLDADGAPREAGEPGLSGWTIYVDYDNDSIKDEGEPFAVTIADGSYTITVSYTHLTLPTKRIV